MTEEDRHALWWVMFLFEKVAILRAEKQAIEEVKKRFLSDSGSTGPS